MNTTFADRIISYNRTLAFKGELPEGFNVLNPGIDHPNTLHVVEQFYRKYYSDQIERKFIIGINPGRLGAGVTGIPFTDTKRLESHCGIELKDQHTHEISSVFVYDMIDAYGGVDKFYSEFFIHSPFPLAIVRKNKSGKWLNANYYDDLQLFESLQTYMIETLKIFIDMGLDTSRVYILGKKNAKFIKKLNDSAQLFGEMVILDHPRYIQQYKLKEKELYIDGYLKAFSEH